MDKINIYPIDLAIPVVSLDINNGIIFFFFKLNNIKY
jgi:hypothetical protein